MPAESCLSAILAHPPPQQQRGYFHLQHGPLESIHFTISDSSNDIKQESSEEPSGFESCVRTTIIEITKILCLWLWSSLHFGLHIN